MDVLDRKARGLSIKTNWTYWHLDRACEAFCVVSTIQIQKMSLMSSRCICRFGFIRSFSLGFTKGVATRSQIPLACRDLRTVRLERHAGISVSRLHLIKLADLQELVGAVSNQQVRSIAPKLQLAEAMQVASLKTAQEVVYID
jgi:hypothetical protein